MELNPNIEEFSAVNKSIKHWERMYENMYWLYDSKLIPVCFNYYSAVERRVWFKVKTGENWTANYCELCKFHGSERYFTPPYCVVCIISILDFACSTTSGNMSKWHKVNLASKVKDWLNAAYDMIKLLYRCRKELSK